MLTEELAFGQRPGGMGKWGRVGRIAYRGSSMREGSEARVCQPELRNSEGAGVSPVEEMVQMSSRSSEGQTVRGR